MPKGRKPIIPRKTLVDKEAFSFYRKNAKYRDIKNTSHITFYRKIIIRFYQKIAEKLLESRGGVFLPGFGYFVVLLNPEKTVPDSSYNTQETILLNPHSNSRVYHPAFLPFSNDMSMKSFTMDKYFNRDFKNKLSVRLKSGMKYKNHYGLLMSIFKNKKR